MSEAKRLYWWKRDQGFYTCEECGFQCSDLQPEQMLEHFVGHRDDDGVRVPVPAMLYFEGLLSFDERCKELAKHFLSDYPGAKSWHEALLAKRVQDAVEGWIAEEEGSGALQGKGAAKS